MSKSLFFLTQTLRILNQFLLALNFFYFLPQLLLDSFFFSPKSSLLLDRKQDKILSWDYKSIYMSLVNLMVSIKKSKKPLKTLKFD